SVIKQFNISESDSLGLNYAYLSGTFNDVLKPLEDEVLSISMTDSAFVITSSTIMVRSLAVTGIPNAPRLNWGQNYTLEGLIKNNGQDIIENTVLQLLRNDNPFSQDTIITIASGDSVIYSWPLAAGSASVTHIYKLNIFEATSHTTGEEIVVLQPDDNLENIIIEEPANLLLVASVADSSISVGQQFQVDVQVQKSGESVIGTGELRINLPANFTLDNPGAIQEISNSDLSKSWMVTSNSVTVGDPDSISITYESIPIDINTSNDVDLSNTVSYIPMEVASSANLNTYLTIISPEGAIDSLLSTGQSFVVKDSMEFGGAMANHSRFTEITVPANYSVEGSSRESITSETSTTWTIYAPNTPSSFDSIFVKTEGIDQNSGDPVVAYDTLLVNIENRALLSVSALISEPSGATDGDVSTNQQFGITVTLANSGVAGLVDTPRTRIAVDLPDGYAFTDADTSKIVAMIPGDTTLFVRAPSLASNLKYIQYAINSTALDTNTFNNAAIQIGSGNIAINTVDSARIEMVVTIPDTVSLGQIFDASITITNTGDSEIEPDSVQIRLNEELWTGIRLNNDDDSLRYIKLGVPVDISLLAETANQVDNFRVQIIDTDASDVNNYQNLPVYKVNPDTSLVVVISNAGAVTLSAQITAPSGAADSILSTNQSFEITTDMTFNETVRDADRLIEIIRPAIYGVNGATNRQLEAGDLQEIWELNSPSTPSVNDTILFHFTGYDKYDGSLISAYDTIVVETITASNLSLSASVTEPDNPAGGALDGLVSTYQKFVWQFNMNNNGSAQLNDSTELEIDLETTGYYLDSLRTLQIDTLSVYPASPLNVTIWTDINSHPLQTLTANVVNIAADENTNA
ncbi:MAG: hypothetical protein KAR38_11520, partial [Calditrichia bacterium]|nr:hypothetical protein [Calditrichia bacterium]